MGSRSNTERSGFVIGRTSNKSPATSRSNPMKAKFAQSRAISHAEIRRIMMEENTFIDYSGRRKDISMELVENETAYCEKLLVILENYKKIAVRSTEKSIVKHSQYFTNIFRDIDDLYALSQKLIKDLKLAMNKSKPIGKYILELLRSGVYTEYANTFQYRMNALSLIKQKTLYSVQRVTMTGDDLQYLLILPIKRMNDYETKIKSILTELEPDDPDLPDLVEALKLILGTIDDLIEDVQINFLNTKIESLSNVSGLPDDIAAPHRRFVRECKMNTLLVNSPTYKKPKTSKVYLFNDSVVICSQGRGKLKKKRYNYEGIALLHDCVIKDISTPDTPAIKLIPVDSEIEYDLMPDELSIKNSWKDEIKECIRELSVSIDDNLIIPLLEDAVGGSFTKMKLRAAVLAGRNLQKFIYDNSDICVTLRLGAVEYKTTVQRNCRQNPQWNDVFVFNINDAYRESLSVVVRDNAENMKLGEVEIELLSLYENVENTRWYSLEDRNVMTGGSVLLSLTVGPSFDVL
eukprot:TRINITY_DN2537_c0_g2_i1.p1 TRINITY_DN2537_c0_g2~~TRINITY_DN2537_c0_g2_i1.p1  ORF type:complete len:552 (+),score=111.76 TRINITY_DN2537_c0_g2_i1:101-1657(+)